MDQPLIVYLPLNKTTPQGFANEAEQGGYASVHGSPMALKKRLTGDLCPFPTYIQLDGKTNFLKISAAAFAAVEGALTIDFWAKIDGKKSTIASTVQGAGKTKLEVRLPTTNAEIFSLNISDKAGMNQSISAPVKDLNGWIHWAVSLNLVNGSFMFFANGRPLLSSPGSLAKGTLDFKGTGGLEIGRDQAGHCNGASLSHFRVWATALSSTQINTLYQQDQGLFGKREKTPLHAPLVVEFADIAGQPAIYIMNDGEQGSLTTTIRNGSSDILEFTSTKGDFSGPNSHFELRFKPTTLKDPGKIVVECHNGWGASSGIANADGTVSIFLRYEGTGQYQLGAAGKPKSSLQFKLKNIVAVAGSEGSRGTRVAMKFRGIQQKIAGGNPTALQGTLLNYLNVVNHHGGKEVPLDVTLISPGSVINDGLTQNKLLFRLHNHSGSAIKFRKHGNGVPASQIAVSFDEGSNSPGNLFPSFSVASMQASLYTLQGKKKTYGDWKPTESKSDAPHIWTFTCIKDFALAAGDSLFLEIDKLLTNAAPGFANAYISIHDLKDFQDHKFVVPVEKSMTWEVPPSENTFQTLWSSGNIACKGRVQDRTGDVTPVGTVVAFMGKVAPKGWLLCDANELTRQPDGGYHSMSTDTDYPAGELDELMAVLGNSFADSFTLPDLRGRFLLGSYSYVYPLKKKGGIADVTLTVKQIPSHNHEPVDTTNYSADPSNSKVVAQGKYGLVRRTSGGNDSTNGTDSSSVEPDVNATPIPLPFPSTGGGESHTNMPPYYTVNYIIKY